MFEKNLTGCRLLVILSVILAAMSLALVLNFTSGWADNGVELDKIRQAIKAKGAKWQAGETSVSRLAPEERKKRLGLTMPPVEGEEWVTAVAEPSPVTTTPASLDWRSFSGDSNRPAGDYVTAVRDQGNCGSCWAFATTAALESNVLFTNKTPGQEPDFAEQVLVSCSRAGSCGGGYIGAASDYIRDYGLPRETCFPYTASNNNCKNACSDYQTDTWAIDSWHYEATTAPSVEVLRNALASHGPLVTTMQVYTDFFYYKEGIYSYTWGSYQGGHAILIVGYDDPGQYFIAKNSWGTGWGESGFFRIAYSQLGNGVQFGAYTIAYVGGDNPSPEPPACTYSISPTSKTFKAGGGTGTVSVTASASNCAWTAVSNAAWIHITSGTSYQGSATVIYTVDPNPGASRSGTMTIAGQTFTVRQTGVKRKSTRSQN